MPELPEVETTRRGVTPHVTGRKVTGVLVRESRLRWPVDDGLPQWLVGQTVHDVSRRAKYLLFETGAGRLMLHLGMSGSLRIVDKSTPPQAHDHVDIVFGDTALRYNDPRRFGSIHWLPGASSHKLLARLGVEPLSDEFDGDYLFNAARGKRSSIKQFIMDSHVVVGVGNIYASESLHLASILPTRAATSISRKRCARLADRIKEVLELAITAGGTTLRDFVREDGRPGYFRHSLKVYGREGERCLTCGNVVRKKVIAQRATFFCRRCQT